MRSWKRAAAAALVAVVAVRGETVLRADEKARPADVKLPFNPAGDPAVGDWARYRLLDPRAPDEKLPPEVFTVRAIEDESVVIVDGAGKTHRYARGEAGLSALAFLRGFFGEDGASQLEHLRGLAVAADPVTVGGARYDGAVRIKATIENPVSPDGTLTAEFTIWVAPGKKAGGILRAIADVRYGPGHYGGALDLDGEGAAGESPVRRREAEAHAPSGTAR